MNSWQDIGTGSVKKLILSLFLPDKTFAVFLSEPVGGIVAAAVTTFTFFQFFRKLMKRKTE